MKSKNLQEDAAPSSPPLQPLILSNLAEDKGPSLAVSMVNAGVRSNSSCWIPKDPSDSLDALIGVWKKLNQEVGGWYFICTVD